MANSTNPAIPRAPANRVSHPVVGARPTIASRPRTMNTNPTVATNESPLVVKSVVHRARIPRFTPDRPPVQSMNAPTIMPAAPARVSTARTAIDRQSQLAAVAVGVVAVAGAVAYVGRGPGAGSYAGVDMVMVTPFRLTTRAFPSRGRAKPAPVHHEGRSTTTTVASSASSAARWF